MAYIHTKSSTDSISVEPRRHNKTTELLRASVQQRLKGWAPSFPSLRREAALLNNSNRPPSYQNLCCSPGVSAKARKPASLSRESEELQAFTCFQACLFGIRAKRVKEAGKLWNKVLKRTSEAPLSAATHSQVSRDENKTTKSPPKKPRLLFFQKRRR